MSQDEFDSLDIHSLGELFRMEVETQSAILTEGLLALEHNENTAEKLRDLMRAAHSLKGAGRMVGRTAAVQIAHAMEDRIVAVQHDKLVLSKEQIDVLLRGVDLLGRIAQVDDGIYKEWEAGHQKDIDAFYSLISSAVGGPSEATPLPPSSVSASSSAEASASLASGAAPGSSSRFTSGKGPVQHPVSEGRETVHRDAAASDRVLRVTADNLSRLLGLAGEALVGSRWLDTFAGEMQRLRQLHQGLARTFDRFAESLDKEDLNRRSALYLSEFREQFAGVQRSVSDRVEAVYRFDRSFASLSKRLYQEVLDCRMRPFADGVQAFPRMIRDLAHSLDKYARVEVTGDSTPVDREMLERLQAPLDHLIRNAVDHGIESPSERRSKGKSEQGTVRLGACHRAGMLLITVSDDGAGISPETLRRAVLAKKLATAEMAQSMSEAELFDFLFLPGFTLKESVSEISGRGVGLDVVQMMVKAVGGNVRVSSQPDHGTQFQLELPLTLSVIRTLLVEIGREPYAIPLNRIETALSVPKDKIQTLEGRQHFAWGQQQIGLIAATHVLELDPQPSSGNLSVIVLVDKSARYGLVVDRFLGEQGIVVRALDPRLGKVQNISAAALMPDGSPLLIIDIDDLLRHIENMLSGNRLPHAERFETGQTNTKRKRVLVVDDSLTVRELERKLLDSRGYVVDVAVDGMDGWNSVRTGHYDLVLTDVDMPRIDGIELLSLIRKDSRLKTLPVMIVSYKDREEDRQRGLEAGADYYLTKGSFQDETLLRAVNDLIGGAIQ
jgi:two-component system sensor histidine kinase and response regulator WspE